MRILGALCLLTLIQSSAFAAIPVAEKDQWKVSIGGFIETDFFSDTVRSFTEVVGNNPVDRADTVNGQTGRAQFSVRNSRLAIGVEAPEKDSWKSKGYLELDFLGFDPAPATAGNTEGAFFNNPTLRVRHAFLQADNGDWQFMMGQYWMLFGWQPYYFMPTLQVAPVPGMLYGRTAQIRAMRTFSSDSATFQGALGVMRPPQRDASLPGLEGGLRLALNGRSAGYVGGSTGPQKTQPMSIGVSGAAREFVIPQDLTNNSSNLTHFAGHAIAADALLPVLASSDGKDVSNTFSLGGEFTSGTGYGDQFSGWSGNLPSPLNSSASAPEKNVNLDTGIGGFDSGSNFNLVNLKTWNIYAQYHLPAQTRTWISAGYGNLSSDNLDGLKPAANKTPYDREQVYFANIAHNCNDAIRVGFEAAHIRTNYSDGMIAQDNRYQFSAWFIF